MNTKFNFMNTTEILKSAESLLTTSFQLTLTFHHLYILQYIYSHGSHNLMRVILLFLECNKSMKQSFLKLLI